MNSPQKTDDSSNEVEFIPTDTITETTVNNILIPNVPLEVEPTMSPLSEILQQIENNSTDNTGGTETSINSDHFHEVQKLVRSFEDVERLQISCNG